MVTNYYVSLNNIHEFKGYCHQTSIQAFEFTLQEKQFPSRFSLIAILIAEVIVAPFYIARKLVEIAINTFLLLNAKGEETKPLQFKNISTLAGMTIIQILLPVTCLAIRIGGTALGLLSPRLSVRSWQVAESGECLSYSFWSVMFNDFNCQYHDKEDFAEIHPTNAIFYLGETQTNSCLTHEEEFLEIETEINACLTNLLKIIAEDDPTYFYKLLYYDQAGHLTAIAKNRPYYCLDHDVKQILSNLKKSLPKLDKDDPEACKAFVEEKIDEIIDEIFTQLTMKDRHRLFEHLYFNLSNAFLDENDSNLNPELIRPFFTDLKDLFSQRFRYGRAHISQSLNNFYFSTTD